MELLSLGDLDRVASEIEHAADQTPGVDPWCSGPDWALPAHLAFGDSGQPLMLRWVSDDHGPSFALLGRYSTVAYGTTLAGLEPMWGFGSPLLSARPAPALSYLLTYLATHSPFETLVLSGVPHPNRSEELGALIVPHLLAAGEVLLGPGITRQIIDLAPGYSAWLGRRSRQFRRNLRQAQARAEQAGLSIIEPSPQVDSNQLFERLYQIELRSWKGLDRSGMATPEMRIMYRAIVERLAAKDRLKILIAQIGGADVGYILGGIRARRYRGLQISFIEAARRLSVGNLLQDHQIRQLADRSEAEVYDMGMDMDYKRRWADRSETTMTLILRPHRASGNRPFW